MMLEQGSWLVYALVFLGGVFDSFTPCVYPIIPITVGYIGSHSSQSRLKGFMLSVVYVLGMAMVYVALGALAALTGTLFGRVATHPVTFFFVANICLLLGLSLWDVFILEMPAFFKNLIAAPQQTQRKGFLGSFLVGMISGLVMGPCTTPVLGLLLFYVAGKQHVFFGVSLLFVFSLGMGMLFILIGTFAGFLAYLPKSGRWMIIVKKILGACLIFAAEYFLISMGKRLGF